MLTRGLRAIPRVQHSRLRGVGGEADSNLAYAMPAGITGNLGGMGGAGASCNATRGNQLQRTKVLHVA